VAPNSLIFLVIIGIWAAYLGKYWLRRRDHLATARSMDRFSESIRVLGQGRLAPSADVHRAPHRSYALTPGGPMRPQVTVKRSVPPVATSASRASDTGHRLQPVGGHPASAESRRRLVGRAVRGVLLIIALAAFVLSIPVALLWDRFPAWGPVVVLANAVAAFLFLRAAVQEDLAAKRPRATVASPAPRPVRRPAPAPAPAPAPQVADVAPAAPAAPSEPAEPAVAHAETVEAAARARRVEEVFEDPTLAPAAPASSPAPRRDRPAATVDPVPVEADDDIPATWNPRPVPVPTYALKQRAGHAVPAPAGVPVPEPIELEDDDEVSFGRVSGA
jgi:hypothetical protein